MELNFSMICLWMPTNSSSILWFSAADVSMYLQSKLSAAARPSAMERYAQQKQLFIILPRKWCVEKIMTSFRFYDDCFKT